MSSTNELDAITTNIELTLASIIQGVALYFLTENARATLSWHRWPIILYVASGLCIIFIFWSRSIVHTLTLIKWPLEFGHNFFYIGCVLGEAILFTRLDRPLGWFALSAAYGAIVWLLFLYDLRLIRARRSEASNDKEQLLYATTERDQWFNIGILLPAMFVFNGACALLIRHRPAFFIDRGGHFVLAFAQLLSFILYLVYVTSFFTRLAPLILQSRK